MDGNLGEEEVEEIHVVVAAEGRDGAARFGAEERALAVAAGGDGGGGGDGERALHGGGEVAHLFFLSLADFFFFFFGVSRLDPKNFYKPCKNKERKRDR